MKEVDLELELIMKHFSEVADIKVAYSSVYGHDPLLRAIKGVHAKRDTMGGPAFVSIPLPG